jgi:hypothetical protein
MTTLTHITTSGGLISAAFVENVHGPGSHQRGAEPTTIIRRFVWETDH